MNDYTATDKNKVANVPVNTTSELAGKLAIDQGSANAGKVPVGDVNGNLVMSDPPGVIDIFTSEGYTSDNGATITVTLDKPVTVTAGVRLRIKFLTAVSRTAATNLSVNGSASAIQIGNTAIGASPNNLVIAAGQWRVFERVGTTWQLMLGMPLETNRQGEIAPNDRIWRALWTGTQSATGQVTIANIFTTIDNPTEIMVAVASTLNRGITTSILPLFIKNTSGNRVRFLTPSTTTGNTGSSANAISMSSDDGTTNSYSISVRFNTETQAEVINRSNTNLVGIYVR
jgi:hypothetical protein